MDGVTRRGLGGTVHVVLEFSLPSKFSPFPSDDTLLSSRNHIFRMLLLDFPFPCIWINAARRRGDIDLCAGRKARSLYQPNGHFPPHHTVARHWLVHWLPCRKLERKLETPSIKRACAANTKLSMVARVRTHVLFAYRYPYRLAPPPPQRPRSLF